jgi:aerobic-type carbon monoxide dehydrogenase small subunit (CoxS/CutS family)
MAPFAALCAAGWVRGVESIVCVVGSYVSPHRLLVQRAGVVGVGFSLRLSVSGLCHAARSGRSARADWATPSLRPLRYMKRKSDRRHSICRAAFVFANMDRVHMTWRALGLAAGRSVRTVRTVPNTQCERCAAVGGKQAEGRATTYAAGRGLHGDTRRWRGAFARHVPFSPFCRRAAVAVAVRRAMQGQLLGQCCTRPC